MWTRRHCKVRTPLSDAAQCVCLLAPAIRWHRLFRMLLALKDTTLRCHDSRSVQLRLLSTTSVWMLSKIFGIRLYLELPSRAQTCSWTRGLLLLANDLYVDICMCIFCSLYTYICMYVHIFIKLIPGAIAKSHSSEKKLGGGRQGCRCGHGR